ncbi:hypothetical protein A176_005110 [Myxococcus hansupus]|uniref:Uncharacterized protein n=1 Tax=Pseudomyxococcus hansupus TaxID=1297742 RepID=A0A0H4X2U5_9BACT|nr:hypothetical protein [Myxococcus hansupus]AKQ68198.1 hypothetical protein A176_005110 [Myxococcus hansupus]
MKKNLGFSSYISAQSATGVPVHAHKLREFIARFSWEETFMKLAMLAGALANYRTNGGEYYSQHVYNELTKLRFSFRKIDWLIGDHVLRNKENPVAHEQAIYFLQSLAILYGKTIGPTPSDLEVGQLLLAANDHLTSWKEEDAPPLSRSDRLTAEFCHLARFNTHHDPLRGIVRTALIFEHPPKQGLLSDPAKWTDLQERAFGTSFTEWLEIFLLPLFYFSQTWGTHKDGKWIAPIITPQTWYAKTALQPTWTDHHFSSLTTTRVEARSHIEASLRSDGLPHAPTFFIRTPFIKLNSGNLVAASPWAIREQLRGGIWMRHREATRSFSDDIRTWTSAFGQTFEAACRNIALETIGQSNPTTKLILSTAIGSSDELEDIVTIESDGIVLFSVKSRLVLESVARQAVSRRNLLNWYEEFLFGPGNKKKKHQPGALRLLDARIHAIRSGQTEIRETLAPIFPVLVTFDDLCENGALDRWIAKKYSEHDMPRPPNTHPPVLLTINDFEALMSLSSSGHLITSILSRKHSEEWRDATMSALLLSYSPNGSLLCAKSFLKRFSEIDERAFSRFFPDAAHSR